MVSLAVPASPNKISQSATNLPAMDRSLSLAGSGLAQLPTLREPWELGNRAIPGKSAADLAHQRELPPAAGLAVPSPERSDLMTDFVPFGRVAVEQAFDRFLDQLEDLGAGTVAVFKTRATWLSNSWR